MISYKIHLLLPLLFCTQMAVAEIGLTLVPQNGSNQATTVAIIGKIQFDPTNLYLFDKYGNALGSTPLNQVHKLVFKPYEEIPTAMDEIIVTNGSDEISNDQSSYRKFLKNSQLFIERDGEIYTPIGQKVK